MVDEVNIKITADASEAKQAFRDIHFYEKALQEDTELLKDLQVEYKKALSETGGKLAGDALKLHKQILDVKSSIAKSEREIERAGKGQIINTKKIFKFLSGNKMALLGTGMVGAAFLVANKIKDTMVESAKEARSEYFSSISTGMSGSAYSKLAGGISSMGVDERNLNTVLTNINNGMLAFKTGIGDVSKLVNLQNRTGISLTDERGRYKTQEKLLEEIQIWVKKQNKDFALYMLSDLGFTADLINEMHDGNVLEKTNIGLSEEQIKNLKELSDSSDRLSATFKDLFNKFTSFLSPLLTGILNTLTDMLHPIDSIAFSAKGTWDILTYDAKKDAIASSLYAALTSYQSGKIGKEEAKERVKGFFGRDLTEEENKIFENAALMDDYIKTLNEAKERRFLLFMEANRLKSEGKIEKAEKYKKYAENMYAGIISGSFYASYKAEQEEKKQKNKAIKLKRENENNARTELGREARLQRADRPEKAAAELKQNTSTPPGFETLDLVVPDKAASSTNGGSPIIINQGATVSQTFTGSVDSESVKMASEEGLRLGFKTSAIDTAQQIQVG